MPNQNEPPPKSPPQSVTIMILATKMKQDVLGPPFVVSGNYDTQGHYLWVKSADNTKAKSMTSLLKSGQVKHGMKLSSKNAGGTE